MEIQKIYSEVNTDEKLYSVLLSEDELALFSEAIEEKKTISKSDKDAIWMAKHLQTKKGREANIEAYDQEGPRNSHKLGKQVAKATAATVAAGDVIGHLTNRKDLKKSLKIAAKNKEAAKDLAKGLAKVQGKVAVLGAGLAGCAYLGTRGLHSINKKNADRSKEVSQRHQKVADINKVASGIMTEEEFASKYGKNIKPNKKN